MLLLGLRLGLGLGGIVFVTWALSQGNPNPSHNPN
jgi:hypothetical protein